MTDFTCDPNYLIPNGFKILIDRKEYPHLQFFAQQVDHPSLDIDAAVVGFKRTNLPFPGDNARFGTLTITALMDENMGLYEELYNWMIRFLEKKHLPQRGKLFRDNDIPSYSDIVVSVLTSHNNPNRSIKYINAFPISLGSIMFTATNDGEYISFPISFEFDYFEFV